MGSLTMIPASLMKILELQDNYNVYMKADVPNMSLVLINQWKEL